MKNFSMNELYQLAWSKPSLAQVELTHNCNQRCIFCYNGHFENQNFKNLAETEWLVIFQKLFQLGIRDLNLTGSETFLYPNLIFLLKKAKEIGFRIRIDTNGMLDISEAIPYVEEFAFSVHGIGKTHEEITQTPGSFANLEENLLKALSNNVKILINMTLTKINYHQIKTVYEHFSNYSQNFKFSPFLAIPSNEGRNFDQHLLTINREFLKNYIGQLRTIPAERLVLKHGFHSIFINNPGHYDCSQILLPNCAGGKNKIVVDYDGAVYPCNFFKGKEHYCGNILTDDATKIWRSGKGFLPFRSLITEEKIPSTCKKCAKKPRCFSGCRAWTKLYRKGEFDYEKDIRCGLGAAYLRSRDNE